MTWVVFEWLNTVVGPSRLQEGDAVQLNLSPNDPRASQYDGVQGEIDEVVHTRRSQTLYAVSLRDVEETIYVEDYKVEAI